MNEYSVSKINCDGSEESNFSKVIDIDLSNQSIKEQNVENNDYVSIKSNTNPNCRLCWDDEFDIENPLF